MLGHSAPGLGSLICIAKNHSIGSSMVPTGDGSSRTIFWFSIFNLG